MIFNLIIFSLWERTLQYVQTIIIKTSTSSRIFAAFILLLIVMLFLSLFNYYQAWVQNRQTSLSSMATRLAYQIEDYRYQASHIYKCE
ncbi:hypothetical protein AB6F55_12775 [Providencia hangzhouensis]